MFVRVGVGVVNPGGPIGHDAINEQFESGEFDPPGPLGFGEIGNRVFQYVGPSVVERSLGFEALLGGVAEHFQRRVRHEGGKQIADRNDSPLSEVIVEPGQPVDLLGVGWRRLGAIDRLGCRNLGQYPVWLTVAITLESGAWRVGRISAHPRSLQCSSVADRRVPIGAV